MFKLIFLLIVLAPSAVLAGETFHFYRVDYVTCLDGDTCTFNLSGIHPFFGLEIPVRLAGVDAPEINGKCQRERDLAVEAQLFITMKLVLAKRIDLLDVHRGEYFRLVARIVADGEDLGSLLLARGFARKMVKKRRVDWCQ